MVEIFKVKQERDAQTLFLDLKKLTCTFERTTKKPTVLPRWVLRLLNP